MHYENTSAIIADLGGRMRAYRIDFPLTQAELAAKSGVSLRSIQNFEHGSDIQFSNLIKILKALHLDHNLDMLVPDLSGRPSSYLLKKEPRQRVSKKKPEVETRFKWGDEA